VIREASAQLPQHSAEEGILAAELEVNGTLGHSGALGDGIDAGAIEADAGELAGGGLQQASALLRVGPARIAG